MARTSRNPLVSSKIAFIHEWKNVFPWKNEKNTGLLCGLGGTVRGDHRKLWPVLLVQLCYNMPEKLLAQFHAHATRPAMSYYETRKLYREIDLTSKLLGILARFTFDFQVAFLARYAMILYWKSGQKSWIRKLMVLLTIRVKVLHVFFFEFGYDSAVQDCWLR